MEVGETRREGEEIINGRLRNRRFFHTDGGSCRRVVGGGVGDVGNCGKGVIFFFIHSVFHIIKLVFGEIVL